MKVARLLALLVIVPTGSAERATVIDHDLSPEHYRHLLLAEISLSDRISMAEHSSPMDFPLPENADIDLSGPPRFVYQSHVLTPDEVREFREAIQALSAAQPAPMAACVPEYHHTLKFYKSGELRSAMPICFQCGTIEWDSTRAAPPEGLSAVLAKVARRAGLQPSRDWQRVAREFSGQAP